MSSYRPRAPHPRAMSSRSSPFDEPHPPVSRSARNYGELNSTLAPKRASVTSATSSGRQSSGSADSTSRMPPYQRTSALPRSTSSSSQARLSYIASTRPMPSFAGKSPPLQTLNLASSTSSILASSAIRNVSPMEMGQPMASTLLPAIDTEEDTVFGIVMPAKAKPRDQTSLPPRLIPELQALAARGRKPINPASSSISSIGSPSTQLTATSSPWSTSTTATTPLSWSSASPSVVQASQTTTSKRSRTVPIPGNMRTHLPKLPVLKENNPANSSAKAALKSETVRDSARLKKRTEPVSDPPPRSSSVKQSRSRSESVSTTKSDRAPLKRTVPYPPLPTTSSVLTALPSREPSNLPNAGSQTRSDVNQGHSRLQQAINSRPVNTVKTKVTSSERKSEELGRGRTRQLLASAPIAQADHRQLLSRSRSRRREPSAPEWEPRKESARSRLAKFSRLALFGRSKTSTPAEAQPATAKIRKGPAAGTGHEGYGRFGKRGRKSSVDSSAVATESDTSVASTSRRPYERRRSRMSSQDHSDLEDFASSRMKPVVLVGGSHRGRTNPFPTVPKNPQHSDVSLSTVCSADSYPAHTRTTSQQHQQFHSSDELPRSTLATRRSQKFAASEESFRFPEPIETQDLAPTPCLDSRNTTQSSDIATPPSDMHKLDPSLLEKQRKKSRRLKWNIFRRKESISGTNEVASGGMYSSPEMPVNVAAVPADRAIPYYVIGSEQEAINNTTIAQFMQEAAVSPDKEDVVSIVGSEDEFDVDQFAYRESLLLPTAPVRHYSIPSTSVPAVLQIPAIQIPVMVVPELQSLSQSSSKPSQQVPTKRQPRLAQVGRIPKVVLTSQQNEPSLQATQQLSLVAPHRPKRPLQHKASRERLLRLDTSSRPVLRPHASSSNHTKEKVVDLVQRRRRSEANEKEFMRISDLASSDFTSSTDSTGIISIMGPSIDSTTRQADAYRASRRQTMGLGVDDENWPEFYDIMDDILSPSQLTKSPSKIKIDQTKSVNTATTSSKSRQKPQGLAIVTAPVPANRLPRPFLDTPPLISLSSIHSLREMSSSEEIRLRRSRIAPALHTSSYASFAPSSPLSMRDLIDEYGRPDSGKFSERLSTTLSQPQSFTPPLTSLQQEQIQPREYENAAHLEEIERTRNPTRHSDKSYASLMVSRWLSFGRVLFSPAHEIFEKIPGKHVLVIDGLGSEDWSIYCSVIYQSQSVYVHDLKERRSANSKPQAVQPPDSVPTNHRRAEVASFNDKFPFPEDFFTAIVVRFPPAMPDSKLRNIVNESRRVLSPGGYLELVVLDLDIVNMGVQTRRAIKDLKIKMSAVDPNISLKPIIDNVQTVLGANGFPNLSRCVVGVPVVGKPATSLDSSSESRSSNGSMAHQRRSSAGPRPYGNATSQANFSLNDLVADHSENADAKIGRVVSRTARSWWQHCFEASIMTDGNRTRSVFASREVLNECKTRAANFKLLIAYTQKPIPQEQKRRTMSEPIVPTLATAGITRTAKT